MKVKEESEKADLKFNIQKTKIKKKQQLRSSPVQVQCMKQGTQKPVYWDNPEGWDGEGGGRVVQGGGHMYTHCCNVWQKPPHYCKLISLQLK